MINCEPMTAKKRAIKIMDVNIIKINYQFFKRINVCLKYHVIWFHLENTLDTNTKQN